MDDVKTLKRELERVGLVELERVPGLQGDVDANDVEPGLVIAHTRPSSLTEEVEESRARSHRSLRRALAIRTLSLRTSTTTTPGSLIRRAAAEDKAMPARPSAPCQAASLPLVPSTTTSRWSWSGCLPTRTTSSRTSGCCWRLMSHTP